MRKKNGGFTLIELMIAIAVLSTMTAVLFQTFVVSGRMDTKARTEEVLQALAKRTMEEMKGYPLEELDAIAEEGNSSQVQIGGETYLWKSLIEGGTEGERPWEQGYILERTYSPSAKSGGEDEYLLHVELDRRDYSKTPGGTGEAESPVYSINQYRMPNIADVSSFQNVVLDPGTIGKDDAVCAGELLTTANAAKNEDVKAGLDPNEPEPGDIEYFGPGDVRRTLEVEIKEESGGSNPGDRELTVTAAVVYTVESADAEGLSTGETTLKHPLLSARKRLEIDRKTGKPVNRVYLFLPESGSAGVMAGIGADGKYFDQIKVSSALKKGDGTGKEESGRLELYAIVPPGDKLKEEEIVISYKDVASGDSIELHTNIGDSRPVSLYAAENRMSQISVMIYEADYSGGGTGTNPMPVPGAELIRLESTRKE